MTFQTAPPLAVGNPKIRNLRKTAPNWQGFMCRPPRSTVPGRRLEGAVLDLREGNVVVRDLLAGTFVVRQT
jgi:hypothetical protein